MKKKLCALLVLLLFIVNITGCQKRVEIELNKDNVKQYFQVGLMGTSSNALVENSDKMYVSEAFNDSKTSYKYGYVYDGIQMTFLVSGRKGFYTCEDVVVTIRVYGSISNIYTGLDSSKAKTVEFDETIDIKINEDYADKVLHSLNDSVFTKKIGDFNEVNGVESWNINYEIVDARGVLVKVNK